MLFGFFLPVFCIIKGFTPFVRIFIDIRIFFILSLIFMVLIIFWLSVGFSGLPVTAALTAYAVHQGFGVTF
jgi:hypothetical protein